MLNKNSSLKTWAFVGLLSILSSHAASADYWSGGHHYSGHPYPRSSRCSQEYKDSSVQVTQGVLQEVAQREDFESASRFRDFVTNTSQLSESDAKLRAYFAVIGVNTSDADAVMNFIGARDHSGYAQEAQRHLGLTPAQADILVQKFNAAARAVIEN